VRGLVKEIKGGKIVVMATLTANGELCAQGEVIAVKVPDALLHKLTDP
jgi:hypothetical protein